MDIDIDNGNGVSFSIDYEETAKMRLNTAMDNIQKYSSMATFDKSYAEKAKSWFDYFSTIKAMSESGDFEAVFAVGMPE